MRSTRQDESGMAHIGVILLVVLVVATIGFAFWRINSKKTQSNDIATQSQAEPLPTNLEGIKTQEEVRQLIGVTNTSDIIALVLESKDNGYVYKVTLSSGKKLVIDAQTGKVLSEESTDVNEDEKIPSGVVVTISSDQAYKIAAGKHSSPIKTIEMEVEDKQVVYKVEYKDGSKLEIDASNGAILKSEIKDESQDSKDQESQNDQTDDSQDN